MRRLARLFSALVIALALGLLAASLYRPPAPAPDLPPLTGQIDRIEIRKAARELVLIQNGRETRRYRVALGFSPVGDKSRQGDGRTPEGAFLINRRNENSRFHLSLGLNYPRPADRARARAGGYDPGGDIMIHGQPNAMPAGMKAKGDWTAGCIALTNDQIREIWAAAPIGTPVLITP